MNEGSAPDKLKQTEKHREPNQTFDKKEHECTNPHTFYRLPFPPGGTRFFFCV